MAKYRVLVTRHESEEWIVEASSEEEAMSDFQDGTCEDEHIITYKAEIQPVLFFDEETTDAWTLEQCRTQYVKDQLGFIHGGNLDDEIEETWNTIYTKENV